MRAAAYRVFGQDAQPLSVEMSNHTQPRRRRYLLAKAAALLGSGIVGNTAAADDLTPR